MKWGSGWEVSANREVYLQRRARQFADDLRFRHGPVSDSDRQREEYLRQRCTCGSGLGDGLCVNCWPQYASITNYD